ncbi:MAG: hypothetical protein WA960_05610 [Tunicatimonas sp.]
MMVIKGGDKQRVLSHIEQCDAVKSNFDNCISIDFNLDDAISAFLKQSIRQTGRLSLKNTIFFNKADFRDYFPRENIGRIGCIYLDVKENRTLGVIYLIFTAATTSMSVLFQKSPSVKDWFIQFGREAGSIDSE